MCDVVVWDVCVDPQPLILPPTHPPPTPPPQIRRTRRSRHTGCCPAWSWAWPCWGRPSPTPSPCPPPPHSTPRYVRTYDCAHHATHFIASRSINRCRPPLSSLLSVLHPSLPIPFHSINQPTFKKRNRRWAGCSTRRSCAWRFCPGTLAPLIPSTSPWPPTRYARDHHHYRPHHHLLLINPSIPSPPPLLLTILLHLTILPLLQTI